MSYKVTKVDPTTYEAEVLNSQDVEILSSINIADKFNTSTDFVELTYYSIDGRLVQNIPIFQNFKVEEGDSVPGTVEASNLTIDPEKDAESGGYRRGGVVLVYNFLRNLIGNKGQRQFYIGKISKDRREVLLFTNALNAKQLKQEVEDIKKSFARDDLFSEFYLNLGNNNLLISLNIKNFLVNKKSGIAIKLYEPLPQDIQIKDIAGLTIKLADTVAFSVEGEFKPEEPKGKFIRGANFTLENRDLVVRPTEELSNQDINNSDEVRESLYETISREANKKIRLSVDYSDYSNFVFFGSAEEQLRNFLLKLQTIEDSEATLNLIQNGSFVSNKDVQFYKKQIRDTLQNFSDYDRYLYFSAGPNSWPKTNTVKPYELFPSDSAQGIAFFEQQIEVAKNYDNANYNSLRYSIPRYIREDSQNSRYVLFVDMIGESFDVSWIYAKSLSDKYDADNRLDFGVAKELVKDTLENFGIKIYSSNINDEDLETSLQGKFYNNTEEDNNTFITASDIPVSSLDYQAEIYKRLYHNLPLLRQAKGTELGLRTLINSFGVPSGSLVIREFGGNEKDTTPYLGPYQEQNDKVRLDNTGSLVEGSVLSEYTSIVNLEGNYSKDILPLEVGFSPAYKVNEYLRDNITSSFDIDDYIGDPNLIYEDQYTDLMDVRMDTLNPDLATTPYGIDDFVRIVKFYDNQLFRMVRDFIPNRSADSAGIIIKSDDLYRSKISSVVPSYSNDRSFDAEIDTAFITGSDVAEMVPSTNYTQSVSTLETSSLDIIIDNELPKFNGILGGSELVVTDGELTSDNELTDGTTPTYYITPVVEQWFTSNGMTEIQYNFYKDELLIPKDGEILAFFSGSAFDTINVFGTIFTQLRNSTYRIAKKDLSGKDLGRDLKLINTLIAENTILPIQSNLTGLPVEENFPSPISSVAVTKVNSVYVDCRSNDFGRTDIYYVDSPFADSPYYNPTRETLDNSFRLVAVNSNPRTIAITPDESNLDFYDPNNPSSELITNNSLISVQSDNVFGTRIKTSRPTRTPISVSGNILIQGASNSFTYDALLVWSKEGVADPNQAILAFLDIKSGVHNVPLNFNTSTTAWPTEGELAIIVRSSGGGGDIVFSSVEIEVTQNTFVSTLGVLDALAPITENPIVPKIVNIDPNTNSIEPEQKNYLPLLGNIEDQRKSEYILDADYNASQINPTNLLTIQDGTAIKASTPDSNYTTIGYQSSRSIGKQLTSNFFNEGTTVDNFDIVWAAFTEIQSQFPLHKNAFAIKVAILSNIDNREFALTDRNLDVERQAFPIGKEANIKSTKVTADNSAVQGAQKVLKSAEKVIPVLYSEVYDENLGLFQTPSGSDTLLFADSNTTTFDPSAAYDDYSLNTSNPETEIGAINARETPLFPNLGYTGGNPDYVAFSLDNGNAIEDGTGIRATSDFNQPINIFATADLKANYRDKKRQNDDRSITISLIRRVGTVEEELDSQTITPPRGSKGDKLDINYRTLSITNVNVSNNDEFYIKFTGGRNININDIINIDFRIANSIPVSSIGSSVENYFERDTLD